MITAFAKAMFAASGQVLVSSIKGEVKKKHFCYGRSFSCFPAPVNEREFGPAAPWSRCAGRSDPMIWVPSTSGFHRLSQRSRSVLRPAKQNGGQVPTIVLSETRGLWLFRVVREGLESAVRLSARGTSCLTSQLRLALEPECLENPTTTTREDPGCGGLGQRHSSCLWFQMLAVEAHSSLPHDQYDGGNLPGQGQTRHLRPDALGQ